MYESFGGGPAVRAEPLTGRQVPDGAAHPSDSLKPLLVWGEHCTECAMPSCYVSCQFYTPRDDLKCQRFLSRPTLTPASDGGEPWLDVHFGKWAVLMSAGPIPIVDANAATRIERLDAMASKLLWHAPLQHGLKVRLTNWWSKKKLSFYAGAHKHTLADATDFELETFNHEAAAVYATLTIREKDRPENVLQHRLVMPPGPASHRLSLGVQFRRCAPDSEFFINIALDADVESARLSFRRLGPVIREAPAKGEVDARPIAAPAKTAGKRIAKCVVWDLDNTVWHGTLVEDGLERLVLREGIAELIAELDRRGVLQSVASKNNPDDALQALEHFGLRDYFLYPQVSWSPKSESIQQIREKLNIGLDTFFFIDDQPFERAQVGDVLPELTVLPETEIPGLLDRPEFDLPVTVESRQRRQYYLEQLARDAEQTSFRGDYSAFLRQCGMVLRLSALGADQLERVHELTQRTNQMNFAGGKYTREALVAVAGDDRKATFVMSCSDRFGEYGVVGFAILDLDDALIEDMMFSCRVQAKYVEHAFIAHAHGLMRARGAEQLRVLYRQTKKNTPVGKVFDDLLFTISDADPDIRIRSTSQPIVQDLVTIECGQDGV